MIHTDGEECIRFVRLGKRDCFLDPVVRAIMSDQHASSSFCLSFFQFQSTLPPSPALKKDDR